MENLLLEPDVLDSDATQDQDDGDDLLAWLRQDNVTDQFADRRFII